MHKTNHWFNQAYTAHQAGDLAVAEPLYRKILRKQAADPEVLFLLGTLKSQQGRYAEAEPYLRKLLRLKPDHPEALNNLGQALREQGRLEEARPLLERAVARKPGYAHAHNNLGGVLDGLGLVEEAEAEFRKAMELDPGYWDPLYNLGLLMQRLGRYGQARDLFVKALELRPDQADNHNDLGTAYKALGRFEEARACFGRAIALKPGFFQALNNLGALQQELGELEPALDSYRQALELRPDDVTTRWNTANVLLSLGRLEEGWAAYECRWQASSRPRQLPFPEWDGGSLAGRTLLVYAEQGLGDEILYASCIPDLLERAAHVVVECEPRLAPLFARSFTGATVRGARRDDRAWLATVPAPDCQAPVAGLPRFLRTSLDRFPDRQGYLRADARAVAGWRRRLEALGPGLKVGLCWRSGLRSGERWKLYPDMEHCGALLGVPGVRFVNLQYDDCAAELALARERFGVEIVHFPDLDLRDDQDGVAALIGALDLVISAGTAVAELAGALGAPTWRYESFAPETALGTGRMPWHPAMELFIKTHPSEPWPALMERLAGALSGFQAGRPAALTAATDGPLAEVDRANQVGLAMEHYRAGRLEPAEALCRQLLERDPDHGDGWHLLGLALQGRGRHAEALSCLDRAIALNPREPTLYCNRGSLHQDLGRPGPALDDYRRALELRPAFPEALAYLGQALDGLGRHREAADAYRRALAQRQSVFAWNGLGTALGALGQHGEAEAAHRRALDLDPGDVPALSNLGNALRRQGRAGEAEDCYRQALASRPDDVELLGNLGNALRDQNRLEEAETLLRRAVALDPEHVDGQLALGSVLHDQGRARESLDAYREALRRRPDDARIIWNTALSLLLAGELREGWLAYQWRWQGGIQSPCPYPFAEWAGDDPAGRVVLVYPEQGLGDELLFASCYPDLIARAGHCVIQCDRRLEVLFRRSFPDATVVGAERYTGDWDGFEPAIGLRAAAGGLPRWLRPDLASFPSAPAYLRPDPARVRVWRQRLEALGPGLKIGIAWRSRLHGGDRGRHYSRLEQWGPVLAVPGVQFVNLQYDDCAAELALARERFGVEIARFPDLDLRDDLDGQAALLAGLDLVVGAGTAVTELAAALGRPVWRLDARPVWTCLGTAGMPWHPTMTLFRKDHPEQPWEPLLERVAGELARVCARGPGDETLARCRHGLMLFDPEQDPVGRALARDGDYAGAEADWLMSLLRPGQVVVETGAGEGAHTLALARAVGDEGLVLALETRRRPFERLCANLALNQLRRVLPLRQALGEERGGVPDPDRPAGSGPVDRWLGRRGLERVSLDGLELPRCDLLVIGEGAAAAVLRGGGRTLAAHKPFIYIRPGADATDLAGLLERSGYVLQRPALARGEAAGVLALPVA